MLGFNLRSHLLPQLWFRNTWSWKGDGYRPELSVTEGGAIAARHRDLGDYYVYAEDGPPLLFCDNEPALQHILIPLDGSEVAEQIVEPAVALGTLVQAEYTLLRVVTPVAPVSAAPPSGPRSELPQLVKATEEQFRADAQDYLDRIAGRLRAKSLRAQTCVVLHPHPAVAIQDAQAHGIDLIAFTTRGHRALPWLFLGSTADKVLRGASTPILVQRPPDQVPKGAL